MRRIGYGGMGEVFLAREEAPGRACVVKKVLPGLAGNANFLARFRDEARVVRRLSHPNIARVWDMGEVQGELYLAMEYVAGKTLNRLMWRLRKLGRVLSPGLALLVAERMCQGLAHAHAVTDEQGHPLHLVHRDLSTANVCISYAGEVKIIDFGAAQSTLKEAQTAPSVVMGSLAYMAPEHARKQRVDRRADVYATGVVLWELLAWQPLAQQGDVVARWRRAAYPEWVPPSAHRAGLPPALDAVVMKALATEPEARFQDAHAFAQALRAVRESLAPGLTDADLARLMREAFAREKTVEDAVLAELVRGRPTLRRPLTERELPAFAPPTALAFEHRALDAPGDFLPSSQVELVEPAPPEAATSREVRVAFDVDLTSHETALAERSPGSGLVRAPEEARGVFSEEVPEVIEAPEPPARTGWLALGLFLAALASGFALMWWWG
ncbi:serine/threonine-protein kinase [Melittangium boletus]|uniref:serine/threonine-protein kinase n=1 Tax=Melittangium boletus TaxID=83453 RepID=UPI003DA64333